jgi:hypothetical protein
MIAELDQIAYPDPVSQELARLSERILELEERLRAMESRGDAK